MAAQAHYNVYAKFISVWEAHIKELQEKIFEAKAKQASIEGLDRTKIDELVAKSVDHVEKATAMNEEIAKLGGVHAAVNYKLSMAKIKDDRMKINMPF